MKTYCLLIFFSVWICMLIGNQSGTCIVAALLLLYLYQRYKKSTWILISIGIILVSLIRVSGSMNKPEQGRYVVYEIHKNYCLATNKKETVVLYQCDDLSFYDQVDVKDIEPIEDLKNIGLFSFSDHMAKRKIGYSSSSSACVQPSASLKSYLYRCLRSDPMALACYYGIYDDTVSEITIQLGLPILSFFSLWKRILQRWFTRNVSQGILMFSILLYGQLFVMTPTLIRYFLFQTGRYFFKEWETSLAFSGILFLWIVPYGAGEFTFVFPVIMQLLRYSCHNLKERWILEKVSLFFCQLVFFHKVNILSFLTFGLNRKIMGMMFLLSLSGTGRTLFETWNQWMHQCPDLTFYYLPSFFFFALLIVWILTRFKKRFLLLCFCLPFFETSLNPFFQVILINIGQGDCTLIVEPFKRSAVMIDCGQNLYRDNVETIILPVLQQWQIHSLDALIITHDDFDHSGGKDQLQRKIPVKKVITKRELVPDVGYPFHSLLPQRTAKDENDESIVSLFSYDGFVYLWMGDAGVDVEYDLMKKYHLNADVLKLGHHGSKTSSSYDFLDTVRPKIGLVSAGLHNRYGHPSSQVISRCHSLGIHTLDTKEVGMIRLCTFHGFMWMETASGLMSLVEK